mmetsp:Transcript_9344/g.24711  ORF Transcript_9344/g.24711 Transcript_9344/m.24711 type:complete len:254 (+) Transcript_9344:1172-1933(+)
MYKAITLTNQPSFSLRCRRQDFFLPQSLPAQVEGRLRCSASSSIPASFNFFDSFSIFMSWIIIFFFSRLFSSNSCFSFWILERSVCNCSTCSCAFSADSIDTRRSNSAMWNFLRSLDAAADCRFRSARFAPPCKTPSSPGCSTSLPPPPTPPSPLGKPLSPFGPAVGCAGTAAAVCGLLRFLLLLDATAVAPVVPLVTLASAAAPDVPGVRTATVALEPGARLCFARKVAFDAVAPLFCADNAAAAPSPVAVG